MVANTIDQLCRIRRLQSTSWPLTLLLRQPKGLFGWTLQWDIKVFYCPEILSIYPVTQTTCWPPVSIEHFFVWQYIWRPFSSCSNINLVLFTYRGNFAPWDKTASFGQVILYFRKETRVDAAPEIHNLHQSKMTAPAGPEIQLFLLDGLETCAKPFN